MNKTFAIVILLCASVAAWAQTAPAAPPAKAATAAKKPAAKNPAATATKPAAAAPTAQPVAVIDTSVGKLTCTLFPDKAPIGVANFIGLAKGTKDWTSPISGAKKHGIPLYDGTIFHRVIPDFMIQGGDPAGSGAGDPGFKFKNETSPDLTFDRPGRLAYANAGPDTNGSQFFVTEVPYASLNGGYTIFGQCDDASVALVKQIARMGKDANDRPYRPVKINHITVTQSVAARAAGTRPATGAKPATTARPAVKKSTATPAASNPQ
jgi:peptidyl-prolyl cis-trans isomerase A (cyclophilin A)